MSTPNRIETNRAEMNRANAQHSTGPNTEAGKRRSSMNALKHGLTGQLRFMSDEVLEIYQAHVKSFHDEYQPQGATEEHLVQALVDDSWRLNRIAELEADLLGLSYGVDGFLEQTKALVNLSLHSQRLSRQFERTVAQLRDLQKTRRSPENWEIAKLLNIVEARQEDGFVFSDTQINHAILPPPDHRVLPSRDHRERFQSRIV
jgi:hypothetical protein